MTSVANLQPDPAPILACTISRDVQNFDLLIDDMENELGEAWGDLSFEDMMSRFKSQSEEKISDLKKVTENRRGGGYSRKGPRNN